MGAGRQGNWSSQKASEIRYNLNLYLFVYSQGAELDQ